MTSLKILIPVALAASAGLAAALAGLLRPAAPQYRPIPVEAHRPVPFRPH